MTTPINVESWIWYGAVVLMLGFRFTARFILLKDIRKFQTEDWFMVFIFCLYTILIVFLNICADVSTNLIEPDEVATLTPQDIKDRVYGSKCVLVVESMMCAVQWGVKACMLLLYYRLTENLGQRRVVKVAAAYCFVTYVVMISLYYGYWCRPFRAFWETPTPNIQCATQIHHLIVNLVFNLTSDLLIIFIPLPLFVKAHLELKKKLLLIFPFSLGFFTMICAILSKHLSFTAPFSSEWIYWYTREASTAMIVSNMPYSWTIIRKVFRVKGFLSGSTGGRPDGRYAGRNPSGASVPTAGRTRELDAKSWPSKTFSFFRRDNKSHKQASETESTGAINDGPSTFNMEDWKDRDIDGKSDPFSSTSSEVSKSAKDATIQTSAVADVDRLYRLDDDDLAMTAAQQQQQRQQQQYTARSSAGGSRPPNLDANNVILDIIKTESALPAKALPLPHQQIQDPHASFPNTSTSPTLGASAVLHHQASGGSRGTKEPGERLPRETVPKQSELLPDEIAQTLQKCKLEHESEQQDVERTCDKEAQPTSPVATAEQSISDPASIAPVSTSLITSPSKTPASQTSSLITTSPSPPQSHRQQRKSRALVSRKTSFTSPRNFIYNSSLSDPTPARPIPSISRTSWGVIMSRPTSLLIASLGNPPPYHTTRHSAAHLVLRSLQQSLGLPSFTPKFKSYGGGHISIGDDVGRPEFTLYQSAVQMNISGPPLLKAWKHFSQLADSSGRASGLVVLHDEMETLPGQVKVRRGNGSARGHNGIKSVQGSLSGAGILDQLGARFVKIGIGIGRPSGGTRDARDVSAYVLGQLTGREKEALDTVTAEVEGLLWGETTRIGQGG